MTDGEPKFVDVDSSNIGIWGWSYGGFLTAMAMMQASDTFKAGVAVAPVIKWENYDSHYTEERFGKPGDNPDLYMQGNPISFANSSLSALDWAIASMISGRTCMPL